ncbi:hypothetical protein SAY86_012377 [Trapa natans]|uniref:Uncharacterized protein n=1 Tax=Trapa natans TaxID=22666 RepID=A0AAN7LS23_TRANT|nr:hypothetical protein SAY86_012377 [Trapa natans]
MRLGGDGGGTFHPGEDAVRSGWIFDTAAPLENKSQGGKGERKEGEEDEEESEERGCEGLSREQGVG